MRAHPHACRDVCGQPAVHALPEQASEYTTHPNACCSAPYASKCPLQRANAVEPQQGRLVAHVPQVALSQASQTAASRPSSPPPKHIPQTHTGFPSMYTAASSSSCSPRSRCRQSGRAACLCSCMD
eukprot:122417-Chlamydomonas_euryale.AAC.1